MMKSSNPEKILFETRTRTRTCGGAEIVGSIGDLLTQIFLHLPLKPLFRFKSVSKQWNSIISDPRFQLTRNQEHKNRAIGLIFQKNHNRVDPPPVETRVVSFDRSSNPLPPQIMVLPDQTLRIFHSCNGLLVLKSTVGLENHYYYVYNPTTKQITPPLLKDEVINARPHDRVVGMYLAFDPSKSPHYKVVCVWDLKNHMPKYQFEVYSSETGSWEIRCGYDTPPRGYINFKNNDGVYWNGAIHWVSLFGISIFFNLDDHDEMPCVMPAPPSVPHYSSHSYIFGEWGDHLHFAVFNLTWVCVYEMRKDYSEWFLKYKVHHYSKCFRNARCCKVQNLYSVVNGKKDEDSFLVLGTEQGEIIRYNLVHNTYETIQVKDSYFQKSDYYSSYITKSFQFFESPCSV